MTDAQVVKLLAVLSAALDHHVEPEKRDAYIFFLKDLDNAEAEAVVREWVGSGKPYFPKVSELRTLVGERRTMLPSPEEAWAAVSNAICRYGRYNPPEWPNAALDAAVRAIGWLSLCNSTEPGVERAQFMRIYDAYRQRAVRDATMLGLRPARELSDVSKQAIAQASAKTEEPKAEEKPRAIAAPQPVSERVGAALERLRLTQEVKRS